MNKPSTSRWVIVACVRKSYRVGFSDPSRPDFPECGLSVFSNHNFLYEHCRGQPAISFIYNSLIPNPPVKINKIPVYMGLWLKPSTMPLYGVILRFSAPWLFFLKPIQFRKPIFGWLVNIQPCSAPARLVY